MENKKNFENFVHSDKNAIQVLLNSNDFEKVISGIIGAVNGIDDWSWVQEKCLKFINNDNFWIAKTAINSLGDIARIHKKMNSELVINLLTDIKNPKLKETIDECIEDILMFVTHADN